MKKYIVYKPGMHIESPAICEAYNLNDLKFKLLEDEAINDNKEFDDLIIIEGEFISNNPLR